MHLWILDITYCQTGQAAPFLRSCAIPSHYLLHNIQEVV